MLPTILDGQSTLRVTHDEYTLIQYTINFERGDLRPLVLLGNGHKRMGRVVELETTTVADDWGLEV